MGFAYLLDGLETVCVITIQTQVQAVSMETTPSCVLHSTGTMVIVQTTTPALLVKSLTAMETVPAKVHWVPVHVTQSLIA